VDSSDSSPTAVQGTSTQNAIEKSVHAPADGDSPRGGETQAGAHLHVDALGEIVVGRRTCGTTRVSAKIPMDLHHK
jgi:hypothetical protein